MRSPRRDRAGAAVRIGAYARDECRVDRLDDERLVHRTGGGESPGALARRNHSRMNIRAAGPPQRANCSPAGGMGAHMRLRLEARPEPSHIAGVLSPLVAAAATVIVGFVLF